MSIRADDLPATAPRGKAFAVFCLTSVAGKPDPKLRFLANRWEQRDPALRAAAEIDSRLQPSVILVPRDAPSEH